jgi:histidinol phosphatase-like PHP family hydrolase
MTDFPRPEHTDYHVHCNFDCCAHAEMTLANVYAAAMAAGLDEICVIKHYSAAMPDASDKWGPWKRTTPNDLDVFLAAMAATPVPKGLHVLSGVETELVSVDGQINIPPQQQARIDVAILSAHWLPQMPSVGIPWWQGEHLPSTLPPERTAGWRADVAAAGAEPFIRELARGYANAIKANPKVRVLSHMGDGLYSLRAYLVPVDAVPPRRAAELMRPVFHACIENDVLWELTPETIPLLAMVEEAGRRGVKFTATVDAHFLFTDGWGYKLKDHELAEQVIRRLSLPRGRLQMP